MNYFLQALVTVRERITFDKFLIWRSLDANLINRYARQRISDWTLWVSEVIFCECILGQKYLSESLEGAAETGAGLYGQAF